MRADQRRSFDGHLVEIEHLEGAICNDLRPRCTQGVRSCCWRFGGSRYRRCQPERRGQTDNVVCVANVFLCDGDLYARADTHSNAKPNHATIDPGAYSYPNTQPHADTQFYGVC